MRWQNRNILDGMSCGLCFGISTNYIAMASSAFLLVALVVEDKIEKLDLWAIGRSGLQIKVVFISVFLGLLWQLSIYLICQFSKAAYPHSTTTELSPLLISVVATGLLGPFTEEMLFRKWLVSMMERVDTFIFAIPICYLFIRYHDVRYCFIAHAVCNLTGIAFPLLVQ